MKSFFDLKENSKIIPGKNVKDTTPGKKPENKPSASGIVEGTHEEADEHMGKAMDAHGEGNEALYHRHLSNYHDKMAEWHSERGREGSAEKHERLADHHHEKAVGLGESTSARLRFAAALKREQERGDRERRLGKELLNPTKKNNSIPPAQSTDMPMGPTHEGVAEGLSQTLRKVVPGHAKREIDKKMDAGKFGKTDADKDANFQRYKKIQDKLKEQGVAEDVIAEEKPGLYANIHAKQRRIKNGSGEHMRKPGSKGAPTAKAFKQAQKTVKENIDDNVNEGIARLISKSIKRVTATKPTPQEKADIRLNK